MAEYQLYPSPKRAGYRDGQQAGGYGESVWTPSLQFGGAAVGMTYSQQQGAWMRVGRVVTVWFDFILTAKGSSTGTATITGLPFGGHSFSYSVAGSISPVWWENMTSSFVFLGCYKQGTNKALSFAGATAAATSLTVRTHADFADNSRVSGNVSYWTND